MDLKNQSYINAVKNSNYLKGEIIVQLDIKDHPRAITIDSCNSLIYWTNWNDQNPSIQTSDLNGNSIKSIIKNDIRTPNGLVIDYKEQKLYYSDAKTDRIYKCSLLNTSNCQVNIF